MSEKKEQLKTSGTFSVGTQKLVFNVGEPTVKTLNHANSTEIGTLLIKKDNKGNNLHVGDKVAYVRRSYSGHTDISIGIIKKETDKNIIVLDKRSKFYGSYGWGRSHNEDADEVVMQSHTISSQNVLLFETFDKIN